jgi:hypothetical protein
LIYLKKQFLLKILQFKTVFNRNLHLTKRVRLNKMLSLKRFNLKFKTFNLSKLKNHWKSLLLSLNRNLSLYNTRSPQLMSLLQNPMKQFLKNNLSLKQNLLSLKARLKNFQPKLH